MDPASSPGALYVGLISGTSMDGIDAVLVDFSGPAPALLAGLTHSFPSGLVATLDAVRRDPDRFPVSELGRLDARLGDVLADAARAVIQAAGRAPHEIEAIGSHGQTIVHHAEAEPPYTLQIGDPHRLAHRSAVRTVADFRRADVAAGGQGAPLAPLLHDALFRHAEEVRCVVNLGGIANVTLLEPGRAVRGFDTGPANCFADLWFRRNEDVHGNRARFDRDGAWARSGTVDGDWLATLLDDPYFRLPPPKSTGIEYFSPAWLERRLPDWAADRPADVQATLAEFSARTVADGIRTAGSEAPDRVLLCGGGVHNADLVRRLERHLAGTPVESTARHGLDPDFVEATLFAWLARERLLGHAVETGPITGALAPVPLGVVFAPGTDG